MVTIRRIKNEYKKLLKDPVCNCSAHPLETDITTWNAIILGPVDTPYEGGVFKLEINFTKKYPLGPPSVRFKTKIFHPNIDSSGGICIDILKNSWNPLLSVKTILLSICSLLNDPNPKDPLVPHIANLYTKNRKQFINEAKNWTMIYATTQSK